MALIESICFSSSHGTLLGRIEVGLRGIQESTVHVGGLVVPRHQHGRAPRVADAVLRPLVVELVIVLPLSFGRIERQECMWCVIFSRDRWVSTRCPHRSGRQHEGGRRRGCRVFVSRPTSTLCRAPLSMLHGDIRCTIGAISFSGRKSTNSAGRRATSRFSVDAGRRGRATRYYRRSEWLGGTYMTKI